MSPQKVLDSFALLAYLNAEAGYAQVRQILGEARDAGDTVLMNEINIGETYYILFRRRGEEKADYFLKTVLPGLPIQPVANDFDLVLRAAKIKARHPLSFADCFAAALAQREETAVVTGDSEFKSVAELVTIEWLNGSGTDC